MNPEDPIFKHYDIAHITGEALREIEAVNILKSLDELFKNIETVPIAIDRNIYYLSQKMNKFLAVRLAQISVHDMSMPYESFDQDGVTIESRVFRISSQGQQSDLFKNWNLYLVGLIGKDQTAVSAKNCPFGALATEDGKVTFFGIEQNDNVGRIIPNQIVMDVDSERILMQTGNIDHDDIKVQPLTYEQRYMVVDEFEKAVRVLQG